MNDWIEIGTLTDIPRLGARTVDTRHGEVAVFRTNEDEVFALRNQCPHKNGPLSEGIVSGRKVACPLHNWVIDLTDGQAQAPDHGCTTSLPIRVDGDRLFMDLAALEKVIHD